MPEPYIYNVFSDEVAVRDTNDISFSNVSNILGESDGSYGDVSSSSASFITDSLSFKFDNLGIEEYIEDNPTLAYVKLTVKFSLICHSKRNASVSLQPFIHSGETDIENHFQLKNGSVSAEDTGELITAEILYFRNEIPIEYLSNENFGFGFLFDCSNPVNDNIQIRVYEVKLELHSGTGIPYLLVTDEDFSAYYLYNDTILLPQVFESVPGDFSLVIYNAGDAPLTIDEGAFLSDYPQFIEFPQQPSPPDNTIIASGGTLTTNIRYTSSEVETVTTYIDIVNTNDHNHSDFLINLEYDVIEVLDSGDSGGDSPSSTQSVIIEGYYNQNSINNDSSFSLSSFPVDIAKTVTINIHNIGNSTLSINNVFISGSGNLASGSIAQDSTISPNSSKNLNITLLTSTQGNKQISVTIVSNATNFPSYSFTLTYAILAQSKIEFKESFSSGAIGSSLVDGSSTNFGTVSKERTLERFFSLRNSGIYKTIIINSVTSTDSNMTIRNLPDTPFTLLTNNTNSLNFSLEFNTITVGLKQGTLIVDYQEGSVIS